MFFFINFINIIFVKFRHPYNLKLNRMRKIILLLLVILSNNVAGQIKTTVFTLDLGIPSENALQSSNLKSDKLVSKTRSPISFILKNGNPYKYKYVINHKFINFFEENAYNPIDSVSKRISGQTSGGIRGPASVTDTSAVAYVSKATNAIDIINENSELAASLFVSNFTNPTNEDEDISNILSALKILKSKTQQLNIEIDSDVKKFSSEDFLDTDEFVKKRATYNSSYIKLISEINKLNSDAVKFPEIKTKYSTSADELSKDNTSIKATISKMFQLKINHYMPPLDVNGKNIDLVEITVERYDTSTPNPTPEKYAYRIWMVGGIKIDVSAGIFLTSIKNKEYETVDKIVTVDGQQNTQKLINEKDLGNLDFGVGSLINISPRGGAWIKPSMNFGALFTANQKFQFLGGVGLIFGKEERIILHGGISLGSRSEISSQYKDDGSESYDLGTSGTVPTVEKFTTGYFFGLTYNFGKIKKQVKKEDAGD
jgi:hypothetical protein